MSAEVAVSALISKVGLVDNAGAPRSLDGKSTLLFYFSAHWCPPCKGFTPQLAEFYRSHADSKSFEIVFVSSDHDETEFKSYFAEMPWTSVTWGTMRSLKSCLGNIALLFCFSAHEAPRLSLNPPPPPPLLIRTSLWRCPRHPHPHRRRRRHQAPPHARRALVCCE